ncbi:M24 family metallopeptidase [Beduini massiliensis]|uniref:M24 family metallopeptidase n=1 Tax=Beduini massiliensis TaxID=1585974 RepID=UPI00294FFAA0|nr:Xaa-Pro peptidase family protein [Beduini massiliensis]
MMKLNRLEKVIDKMKEKKMDYMIISDPSSIHYLCGVNNHPGERMYVLLIDAKGSHRLFLNKLFFVLQDVGIEKVWFSDTDDSIALLADAMQSETTIGIDKFWPAHFLLALQEKMPNNTFINGSSVIDEVRMVKEQDEIETMMHASQINDQAIERLIATLQPTDTELSMSERLLAIYQELGASGHSFSPIVAFGKNGADPHHGNDETRIQSGDSIIIDMGCLYQDYCSDMTRTFFYQCVSDKQKEVYNIVKEANLKAQAMIKPGVRLCDIDAAARDYITEKGYGEYFTHRLGHFIGRDVHEYGDVSSQFDMKVEAGMIFSIEPGIYLPNEFGVRVEDLVVVTKTGCESLNHYSKELKIVD